MFLLSSHFHTLGLPEGADPASIKLAFRRLASIFHPDKNPHHQQRFLSICQAYQALMAQPQTRASLHTLQQHNRRDPISNHPQRLSRHGHPGNRRFECVLESQYKGVHLRVKA